jgi:hypothetical protein
MTVRHITHELLFARCANWNTQTCPQQRNPIMGLSLINRDHLFLLSDETVSQLKVICRDCPVFKGKRSYRYI